MNRMESVFVLLQVVVFVRSLSISFGHQIREIEYKQDVGIDGRISTSVSKIYDKMSRIQCGSTCTEVDSCFSYFYNVLDGKCALMDNVPVTIQTTISENGWVYFDEKKFIAAPVNQSLYIGHESGYHITDVDIWGGRPITGLILWCSDIVQGIQARYGAEWGPLHGNNVGDERLYDMKPREYIHKIYGEYGYAFEKIVFTTNERVFPPCGGNGGWNQKTVSGTRLAYIAGRSSWHSFRGILAVWTLF